MASRKFDLYTCERKRAKEENILSIIIEIVLTLQTARKGLGDGHRCLGHILRENLCSVGCLIPCRGQVSQWQDWMLDPSVEGTVGGGQEAGVLDCRVKLRNPASNPAQQLPG